MFEDDDADDDLDDDDGEDEEVEYEGDRDGIEAVSETYPPSCDSPE